MFLNILLLYVVFSFIIIKVSIQVTIIVFRLALKSLPCFVSHNSYRGLSDFGF